MCSSGQGTPKKTPVRKVQYLYFTSRKNCKENYTIVLGLDQVVFWDPYIHMLLYSNNRSFTGYHTYYLKISRHQINSYTYITVRAFHPWRKVIHILMKIQGLYRHPLYFTFNRFLAEIWRKFQNCSSDTTVIKVGSFASICHLDTVAGKVDSEVQTEIEGIMNKYVQCGQSTVFFIFVLYVLFCWSYRFALGSVSTTDAAFILLKMHQISYLCSGYSNLKGTVSRDFLLLVFLMNQFPPSPRVSH